MAYISIFEKKSTAINKMKYCERIINHLENIGVFIQGQPLAGEKFLNQIFIESNLNEGYTSINDFLSEKLNNDNFKFLSYHVTYNLEMNDDEILANIDVIVNCLNYAIENNILNINNYNYNDNYIKLLFKAVSSMLLEMGFVMEFNQDKNRFMIVSNDIPINIDEIEDKTLAEDVLNYYDYKNSNNVTEKRKILTNLIIELEPKRTKIGELFGNGIEKSLFLYGNNFNLRHCNIDNNGNNEKNFKPTIAKLSEKDFIEWYDFIYPIALMVYNKIDKVKYVNIKGDFKD